MVGARASGSGSSAAGGIARPHVDGYLRVPDAAQRDGRRRHRSGARRAPRRARRRRAGLRGLSRDARLGPRRRRRHLPAPPPPRGRDRRRRGGRQAHPLREAAVPDDGGGPSRSEAAVAAAGITLMCSHNQLFLPPVAAARQPRPGGRPRHGLRGAHDRQLLQRLRPELRWAGGRTARRAAAASSSTPATTRPTCCCTSSDSEPIEVIAMLSRHRLTFMEGEDSAQVVVRFDDGSVGTMVDQLGLPAGRLDRALLGRRRGRQPVERRHVAVPPAARRGDRATRRPADRRHRDDPAGRRRLRRVPARGPPADQDRGRGHQGAQGDPRGVRLGRAGPDHLARRRCSRISPG